MESCLISYGPAEQAERRRSSVSDYMEMMNVSPLDYAKSTMVKVLALVVSLAAIREKWQEMCNEREVSFSVLAVHSSGDTVSLPQTIRARLADHEQIFARMESELQEVNEELRRRKAPELVEQELESLQTVVNSLKADILLKDNQVRRLQEEIKKLTVALAGAKAAAAKAKLEARPESRPPTRQGQVTMARASTPFMKMELNLDSEGSTDAPTSLPEPGEQLETIDLPTQSPRRPQLQATRTSQNGLSLPPLGKTEDKKVEFRFLKDTTTNQKARPIVKSIYSMSTGVTHIGRNMVGNASFQKHSNMLQVSAFGGGAGGASKSLNSMGMENSNKARPAKQPRFGNFQFAATQPTIEMKRNASFYR